MKKFATAITAISLASCLLSPLALADGRDGGADNQSYTTSFDGSQSVSNDNGGDQGPLGKWKNHHPEHTKVNVHISFKDTDSVPWAQAAIQLLVQEGIISGMDKDHSHFAPQQGVTREQFARMIDAYFILNTSAPATFTFIDVPQQRWSYDYVEAAAQYMDYYTTLSGSLAFHPTQAMSREDVAIVLVQILKKQGLVTALPDKTTTDALLASYDDEYKVSTAARPYVAEAVALDLLKGVGDNLLAPLQGVTRAQAAAFLARIDQNQLVIPTIGSTTGTGTTTGTTTGTGTTTTGTATSGSGVTVSTSNSSTGQ